MEKGSDLILNEGNICALQKFFYLNETFVNCHRRIKFEQNEGPVPPKRYQRRNIELPWRYRKNLPVQAVGARFGNGAW